MEIYIPDITEQLVDSNNKRNKNPMSSISNNELENKPNIQQNYSYAIAEVHQMPVEKKSKKFRFLKNDRAPIINLKRFRKKDKKIAKTQEEVEENSEKELSKSKEPHKIRHHLKKSCKIS